VDYRRIAHLEVYELLFKSGILNSDEKTMANDKKFISIFFIIVIFKKLNDLIKGVSEEFFSFLKNLLKLLILRL